MGLGKTITCVSLIAATLESARKFSETPIEKPQQSHRPLGDSQLSAGHFAGAVWGMPDAFAEPLPSSSKGKAKATKEQDRAGSEYARACRIKTNSRATLIICPLSTVSNWEDQFREHWKGEVTVVGGCATASVKDAPPRPGRSECSPLRVYVYHGNSRKPDPHYLADFDAVITTYATLASEFSKQARSVTPVAPAAAASCPDPDEDDYDDSGDDCIETDERGNQVIKVNTAKCGMKRKKDVYVRGGASEATSALQSVNWFRVVLDEAQYVASLVYVFFSLK